MYSACFVISLSFEVSFLVIQKKIGFCCKFLKLHLLNQMVFIVLIVLMDIDPTIVDFSILLSKNSPILTQEYFTYSGVQKNKISFQFTCENTQFHPLAFAFDSKIDPMYFLKVFKRKIQSGSFVFIQ